MLYCPSMDAYEQRIRDYFDACNTGDAAPIAAHFEPDAVHYFPAGAAQGTFAGADAIGAGWASVRRAARLGSGRSTTSSVGRRPPRGGDRVDAHQARRGRLPATGTSGTASASAG